MSIEATRPAGLRGAVRDFVGRVRGGDLGSLPVIVGLIVIWAVFQVLNPTFLSSTNLVNLTMQSAAVGTIAIGIVLVLLLGEIDLSVGSVSGLSSAILAVGFVQHGFPLPLVLVASLLAGAVTGLVFGLLRTRFGVPSFVITLGGLLGILGLQLFVLGKTQSINIPFDSLIVQFGQQWFLPAWLSYVLVAVSVAVFAYSQVSQSRRREAAGLSSTSTTLIAARAGGLLVVLGVAAWYLNLTRGVGAMFALFLLLVVIMHFFLTRTRWGRSVYAVGGNVEAARRAGIRVNRVYISVFMLCSLFAALGGLLAAARLAAANSSSGGGDTNLNAIAAAVIGGTSLFGGRGSAFSAVLGILVIMSISSGLALLNLDSDVRYMVTGAVLLLAVVIDSLSRRSRAASGRA
jgi:D-xylose transport system permease protein